MPSPFPPWFRELPNYPFIDSKRLKDLHAQLYQEGIIQLLEKSPGTGIRATAHWLRSFPEPVKICYLGGCTNESDVLLCISAAFGRTIQAKVMPLAKQIRSGETRLIILDGVEKSAISVIEQLSSLISDLRWILIGEIPLSPHKISIFKLPSRELTIPQTQQFSANQNCLAFLPAGLNIKSSLKSWARHPSDPEKVIMCRSVARKLRKDLSPTPSLRIITKFLKPSLQLAFGAPFPSITPITTLFALRWLSQTTTASHISLQASIACARLHLMWGQINQAFDVLNAAQHRDPNPPPRLMVMLYWVSALVHLQYGDWHEGENKFQRALELSQSTKDRSSYSFLLRKRAETRLQWGKYPEAEKDFRIALNLSKQLNNYDEQVANLRGIAELAMINGESIASLSLLDHAQSLPVSSLERNNLNITLAGLLIHRNALAQAKRVLDETDHIEPPLLHANSMRRRAELSLAEQRYEESLRYAQFALKNYQRLGERVAVGSTLRLIGDIYCFSEKYKFAFNYYREALTIQAEIKDVNGLKRSLEHTQNLLRLEHPNVKKYLQYISNKLTPKDSAHTSKMVPNLNQ